MVRLRGQFNPVGGNHPLIYARLVEAVKTSPSQGEGYGFESRAEYHTPKIQVIFQKSEFKILKKKNWKLRWQLRVRIPLGVPYCRRTQVAEGGALEMR